MSTEARIGIIILAAGQGRRMGGPNKLLARIGGVSLARRAAEAALASRAASVTVVTGHRPQDLRAELDGLDVSFAHNPDFADGLSTSLRTGVVAVGNTVDAVLVMLADMPAIDSKTLDGLMAAFSPVGPGRVVVPTGGGQRGNPVIWARDYFEELGAITGDKGARDLITVHAGAVLEIEIGAQALLDLDTPDALGAAGGSFAPDRGR